MSQESRIKGHISHISYPIFPSSGFTLMELLVAVGILMLLFTMGIVAYSLTIKNARDQQRVSDLNGIKQALEEYRSDQHFYPFSISFDFSLTNASGNPNFSSADQSKVYLSTIPNDPERAGSGTGKKYSYVPLPANCRNDTVSGFCTGFVLCASGGGTQQSNPCPSVTPAPDCGTGFACNLGVSSQ